MLVRSNWSSRARRRRDLLQRSSRALSGTDALCLRPADRLADPVGRLAVQLRVTAVDADHYLIDFAPTTPGINDPLIEADPASYNFTFGFEPSVTVTETQTPGKTVTIPVVTDTNGQTLTITSSSGTTGQFTLSMNGATTPTLTFDSSNLTTTAHSIANALSDLSSVVGLGGASCVYSGTNGSGGYQFQIAFGSPTVGVAQHTASFTPISANLTGTVATKTTVTNAQDTAVNIQEAIDDKSLLTGTATTQEAEAPTVIGGNYTTSPVVTVTAPDVTVTPVTGSLTQYDVTFVGVSGNSVQPMLQLLDSSGNPVNVSPNPVSLIKGPSPEFMVNNPDPSDPGLLVPLNYSRTNASVAMDASGDFVITWDEQVPNSQTLGSVSSNPGSVTDIFARTFQPVSYTSPAATNTCRAYRPATCRSGRPSWEPRCPPCRTGRAWSP